MHQQCEGNLITFALFKCYLNITEQLKTAYLFLAIEEDCNASVALDSAAFHSFSKYARYPVFCFSEMKDFCFSLDWDRSFLDEDRQTMVMLVVKNLWFSGVFCFFLFFCRDEDNGSPDLWLLYLFLSFSVYIFLSLFLCLCVALFFGFFGSLFLFLTLLFLGWFLPSSLRFCSSPFASALLCLL